MATPEMTFYTWLKTQTKRQDRIGDLARDVVRDEDFPKGRRTYKEVFDHIRSQTDWSAVFESLQLAWQEYDPTAETWVVDPEEAGEAEMYVEEEE